MNHRNVVQKVPEVLLSLSGGYRSKPFLCCKIYFLFISRFHSILTSGSIRMLIIKPCAILVSICYMHKLTDQLPSCCRQYPAIRKENIYSVRDIALMISSHLVVFKYMPTFIMTHDIFQENAPHLIISPPRACSDDSWHY